MHYPLLHVSSSAIAFNPILTADTFSAIVPNFLTPLPQIKLTPGQVSMNYSQMNPESHLERALAFKTAANIYCPSNAYLPIIYHRAFWCRWLMTPIWSKKQNNDTDHNISDDGRNDPGESTIWAAIQEDYMAHRNEVLLLGQVRQDKSFPTTRVQLPKIQSYANNVIAFPLLPSSRNPARAMAPPLLIHQKSIILNKLSKCDCAPYCNGKVLD